MKTRMALLLLVLTILLAGCTNHKNISENNTIKIGILPDNASIPFVIANELGYFGEEGLDVELQLFRSAVNRDSAFQANEIQYVSTDVLSLGLFKESETDVYAVAKTGGTYGLVVHPNSNILEIKDLVGKNIGLSFNTLMEYLLDTALKHHNIRPDAVNKISIPSIPARMEMLNTGQIDAATLPEPLASTAVAEGSSLLAVNSDFDTFPGILMTKKEYTDADPGVIKALYNGYNKAVDYINSTSQEEYFDIIKEKLAFPENSNDFFEITTYEYMMIPEEEEIEKGIEWLLEKGLISKKYSYSEFLAEPRE